MNGSTIVASLVLGDLALLLLGLAALHQHGLREPCTVPLPPTATRRVPGFRAVNPDHEETSNRARD
jgi:hypothetical protein